MRKLFSVLSLVLLFCTLSFGQAAVDLLFTATSTTTQGWTRDLNVGLDLTATTCIDPSLGESDLPPFPPADVFEIRFDLSPYGCTSLSTYKDYRNAPAFPFTGTVQHTLWWQPSWPAAISIAYTLPPQATMTITDQIGGGFLNSGPLSGTGTFTIPQSYNAIFAKAWLTMTYTNIGPATPEPIFGIAPPPPLAFGNVNIGSSSTLPVTVSNTGNADLVISNITSSDAQFTFSPPAPVTIPAGGNQLFNVTFTPTLGGNQSANLVFTHNAAGSPSSYALTGFGVSTLPVFQVSPPSLNFGNTNVGTPKTLPVTVHNAGTVDPLIISNASIAAPEFTVNPTSATIPAGGSQVFNVTFTPPVSGPFTGTLVFDDNAAGSPHTVPLSGNGYIPPPVYGLIFDLIADTVYENAFYSADMDLLNTDGPLHALQFRLLTNMEVGDDILLTYQSIQKNSAAIAGPNWILQTNVVRGTIHSNGASEDTIYVLLYNIEPTGDLPAGDYNSLFKVNYKAAKLPPTILEQHSTFRIFNAEGSTFEGFPVNVTPSRDIFTVVVKAAGGGYGDVNGDGCVDILDLIMVVDHIVGRDSLDGRPVYPDFISSGEFARADIAPWTPGDPAPHPDGVVNVQDLSVIQSIILTGFYPNGQPVAPCGYFAKSDGAADATVTLYINNDGITAYLDADIGIRGAQIEFRNVSDNTENMIISTPLGQGYHLFAQELLRTLMYDRSAQKYIDAGVNNLMADMPFTLTNPNDVTVAKIVLVDINTMKLTNITVQTVYGTPTLPLDYILYQNYPNPFNPNTSVKFQVPKTSDVTIKIYDMLGQEVRTLFAGQVTRGTYSVNWDGVNNDGVKMSSGSYIYRMNAGEFVQSKKMILLK